MKVFNEIFHNSKLHSFTKNKFGTYVLQKAISYMDDSVKNEMMELVKRRIMKENQYEKEILRYNLILEMLS